MIGGLNISMVQSKPTVATQLFYLDATTGVANTGDGTPVTAVTDQSGAGNNATCTSPNRPVYLTTSFSSGTKAGVYFERVGVSKDFINMTSRVSCPAGFSAFVYFSVDITDTPGTSVTTTGNVPLTIIGDNTTNFTNAFGCRGSQVAYSSKVSGSFTTTFSTTASLADGNGHSIGVIHDLAGNVTLFADGVSSATATGRTYDAANTGFNIIGVGRSQTDQFWGDVAEVRVYNGAITSTQMTALHTAASTKWS